MSKQLFVLGATGFIGSALVKEALAEGWRVTALARSPHAIKQLRQAGVTVIEGDAMQAQAWITHARDADAVVDLVQPELPQRLTNSKMREVVQFRLKITEALLLALVTLPATSQPLLLSVSGTDDLQPDHNGNINESSPLRTHADGFGQIGIPVWSLIENSYKRAVHIHLGHVYGIGKFTDRVLPALKKGKFPIIGHGNNRLPFVHVEDVARALLHIAALGRDPAQGNRFVVAEREQATSAQLIETIASAAGAPKPKRVPRWLATLIAGKPMVSEMTCDLVVDSGALSRTGFSFRHAVMTSLPAILAQLDGPQTAKEEQRYA